MSAHSEQQSTLPCYACMAGSVPPEPAESAPCVHAMLRQQEAQHSAVAEGAYAAALSTNTVRAIPHVGVVMPAPLGSTRATHCTLAQPCETANDPAANPELPRNAMFPGTAGDSRRRAAPIPHVIGPIMPVACSSWTKPPTEAPSLVHLPQPVNFAHPDAHDAAAPDGLQELLRNAQPPVTEDEVGRPPPPTFHASPAHSSSSSAASKQRDGRTRCESIVSLLQVAANPATPPEVREQRLEQCRALRCPSEQRQREPASAAAPEPAPVEHAPAPPGLLVAPPVQRMSAEQSAGPTPVPLPAHAPEPAQQHTRAQARKNTRAVRTWKVQSFRVQVLAVMRPTRRQRKERRLRTAAAEPEPSEFAAAARTMPSMHGGPECPHEPSGSAPIAMETPRQVQLSPGVCAESPQHVQGSTLDSAGSSVVAVEQIAWEQTIMTPWAWDDEEPPDSPDFVSHADSHTANSAHAHECRAQTAAQHDTWTPSTLSVVAVALAVVLVVLAVVLVVLAVALVAAPLRRLLTFSAPPRREAPAVPVSSRLSSHRSAYSRHMRARRAKRRRRHARMFRGRTPCVQQRARRARRTGMVAHSHFIARKGPSRASGRPVGACVSTAARCCFAFPHLAGLVLAGDTEEDDEDGADTDMRLQRTTPSLSMCLQSAR